MKSAQEKPSHSISGSSTAKEILIREDLFSTINCSNLVKLIIKQNVDACPM
jgi:hypothetical protein